MSLRNMIDSQKERIRQKICTAISEIWHRETGSILPLSIEGTICITPYPGRTTAFQVSSQVPGKFPVLEETCNDAFEIAAKRRKVSEFGEWCASEDFSSDAEEHSTLLTQSKPSSACDGNNNQSEMMDAEIHSVDSKRLPPNGGCSETSDQEIGSSDADLSTDSTEYSNNASGKGEQSQDDGMNNDSGVHDLSTVEGNNSDSHRGEVRSIALQKSKDSEEGSSETVSKETDENRSTPPPLVIDLSAHEPSRPVLSLMYSSANVQTAMRNMLSSKLVATSICTISDRKMGGDVLHLTPLVTANGSAPQLILQKTIQANERVQISALQAPSFPKHSAPISFVYPIGGKQFVQGQLQSILSIANTASGGVISVKPSTKQDVPLNVSLQAANSTNVSSSSVKAEPEIDHSSNNVEQKSYRCEYCQKTFLFKSKYQEHLPVHTTERPFECQLCQRTYKYKYDLNVHQRTHQGIPTKSTICPKCNHRFPTNRLLRVHFNDAHKDDENLPKVKPEEMEEETQSMKSETNISTSEIH